MKNPVKKAIRQNKVTIGSWLQIGSNITAEIMAKSGFDWLVIDTEHGGIDLETGIQMMQAMKGTDCVPFVRVPQNDTIYIRRFLDAGAYGIIVPRVNSGAEAEMAVRACKYPPLGERGIGMGRAHNYGAGFKEYLNSANKEIVLILQIEHIDAVKNINEIVETPGIDGVFIGPYDLSGSMGLLGKLDHPEIKKALRTTFLAAKKAGLVAGMHVVSPSIEQVRKYIKDGCRFIALGMDTIFLQTSIEKGFAPLKKSIRK